MFAKISDFLNRQDTLEKKLFWGLSLLLTLVCVVSLIMTAVEYMAGDMSLTAVLMAGLCVLPSVVIMAVCRRTQAYGKCYMAMVIVMGALLLPLTFFSNGGLHSGMPVYCLGGIFMCALCMEQRYRMVSCVISLISCVACFVLSRTCPDLVSQIESRNFVELDIIMGFVIISLSIIAMIELVMNEYNNAIVRVGKEAERKAEMRLELMNVQLENVADLKRIRHDERHHNALILAYAENGDLEGLKRYIKQKMDADEYYATKIYCMNAVINNILTVYNRRAQKENIAVTITADVRNNLNISEPDLIAIVANMFENAINGAGETEGIEKRINVDIHSKGGRLVIKVNNTCRPDLQLTGGLPAKRAGTGINSIMNAANNYDGTVSYKCGDGVLSCAAILMIPD